MLIHHTQTDNPKKKISLPSKAKVFRQKAVLKKKYKFKRRVLNYFYAKVAYAQKVKKHLVGKLRNKAYLELKIGPFKQTYLRPISRRLQTRFFASRKLFYCAALLNNRLDRILMLSKFVEKINLGQLLIKSGYIRVNNRLVTKPDTPLKQHDIVTISRVILNLFNTLEQLKRKTFTVKRRLLYFYRTGKNFLLQYACYVKKIPPYLMVDSRHGFIIYTMPFFSSISTIFARSISRYLINLVYFIYG